MTYLNWINIALSILTFGSFILVALFYFENKDKTSQKEFIMIKYLGMVFIITHWVAAVFPRVSDFSLIGTVFLLLSFLLMWSSVRLHKEQPLDFAFSSEAPNRLTQIGPYGLVRHPIYLSYLLGWIGGALASGWFALLISAIVMGSIYIKAINEEEQNFLASGFSEEYSIYSKKVKRLIPYIY